MLKVQGHSMFPVYAHGSFILLTRWFTKQLVKPGKHLVLRHPNYGFMLKTVEFIDRDGLIWCRGENRFNAAAQPSEPVKLHQVFGVVLTSFGYTDHHFEANI